MKTLLGGLMPAPTVSLMSPVHNRAELVEPASPLKISLAQDLSKMDVAYFIYRDGKWSEESTEMGVNFTFFASRAQVELELFKLDGSKSRAVIRQVNGVNIIEEVSSELQTETSA